MTTALATPEDPKRFELVTGQSAEEIQRIYKLVRDTINPDLNQDEMHLFMHDCKRQGVHPLDRMIHPTVRTDKKTGKRRYVSITSIDLFRARAGDTGDLAGIDDAVFAGTPKKEGFKASLTVWKTVKGTRCPFTATARWEEYVPSAPNDWMWLKMPHSQLGKCAEALALRKAFPRQLQGVYEKAEMEQSGDKIVDIPLVVPDQPQDPSTPVDVTPIHEAPPATEAPPSHFDATPEEVAHEKGQHRHENIPADAELAAVTVVGFNPRSRTLSNGAESYSLRIKFQNQDDEVWASTFHKDEWETGKLLKGKTALLLYKFNKGYCNFYQIDPANA